MKPCVKNQKLIAWLVLDALDARQAQPLREHLATCEGCRRYLAEISNVTESLAAVEINPEVQASEKFHRKLAGRLRSAKQDSLGEILAAYLARLNWRVALPAVAALVVIGVTVATWRQSSEVALSPQPGTPTALVSSTDTDLAPTIANYQRVANQSLAKLDALLTQQGNQALPSMPIYTTSTRTLANGSF
ncbi:MAG: zf-HC2 domain-containing protein [Verrucomicrobiia bacterium]